MMSVQMEGGGGVPIERMSLRSFLLVFVPSAGVLNV